PAAIVPEPLLLPLDEDGWTLAVDAHRAQLRCGPWTGWTLDRDALEVLLSRALDEAATPPGSLTVWGVESDAFGSAAGRVGTIRHADAPDLETLLSRGGDAPPALDLLQGAFARETETRFRWRDWRLPAALAAGLLLLLLGQKLWQVSELADESEHLDDRLRATLRESVPDIRRVVDPVAQMRQELAARRGGAGDARFLDLLAATGRVLGDETGWQLAGLDYRDGTLQLQLRMPGFDHFERLRARFAASDGIEAEVGSLGSAEGEVRGSVTVRGGGA
ncbi:MAG: type II secretion system protein GspL, partial [Gammaproteobacteria bacterium]|nr:type II secretion system protein GspL [Gammaproteobacteria bacterium]